MQPVKLLKSTPIANVDKKQTLLILPIDYMRRFSTRHAVTFQELDRTTLLVQMVAPHERAYNRPYKLVTCSGSSWVSIPMAWLRNVAARVGDRLDLYSTADPGLLLLKFRKFGTAPLL